MLSPTEAPLSKLDRCRVLIYSHDSFGLGHLRRCRAIAHALVDAYKGISVLILSGSPIIGQFNFKARVDFIRIPGVIKLHNGDYTSLGLHISLDDTLALRGAIVRHTAEVFAPDIFLVDKEPGGLNGEVLPTLRFLRERPTRCVLGLRDVMDDPALLRAEWARKKVMPTLRDLYDEIWCYGPRDMGNPIEGALAAPAPTLAAIEAKCRYTGYLERELPEHADTTGLDLPTRPYLLVTAGGGGDGLEMIDWVVRAYAAGPLPRPALVVLGPFMPQQLRDELYARAESIEQLCLLTFTPSIEVLMENALAVVAMGGYNTFCELLSFDKPALIVPRVTPRREQLIRAQKASALGLVSMLHPEALADTGSMRAAICALLDRPPPSAAGGAALLTGLGAVARRVAELTEAETLAPAGDG